MVSSSSSIDVIIICWYSCVSHLQLHSLSVTKFEWHVVVLLLTNRSTHFTNLCLLISGGLIEFVCFSFSLQSKCSMFRGVIFCLFLNMTYANVVRFPRELDRHGVAFLLPYVMILMLVGLPIILLEVALGQFLGQGSAHSWRASPILRGTINASFICDDYVISIHLHFVSVYRCKHCRSIGIMAGDHSHIVARRSSHGLHWRNFTEISAIQSMPRNIFCI